MSDRHYDDDDTYDLACHSCGYDHQLRVVEDEDGNLFIAVASSPIDSDEASVMRLARMYASPTIH